MDLPAYRQSAEAFVCELTGVFYRHYAGLESLQIEIVDAAPSGSHPESAAILGRAAAGVAIGATA